VSTAQETAAVLSLADAKLLITLCLEGKLYAVEKWIAEGKSLHVPPECRSTPLQIGIERGFHSLVELLARNDSGQKAKNDALIDAVSLRNLEFVELLLNHGAEISCVPFSHVLLNWDPTLIRFFLDRGADFIAGAPFTEAFTAKIRTALRPFLECKRNHPEFTRELQQQADSALRYFCDADNEKWVSLMLWVGADPRSSGPSPGHPDEPDYYTTAFRQAAYQGNVKILKLLKPQPDRDNISELVCHSAMFGRTEAVSFFLEFVPNLNDKPNGGSSALDGSLWHLGFDRIGPFYSNRQRAIYEVRSSLNLVQKLVERGAVWNPMTQVR
jgi:ankyrin repeat protein